MGNTTAANTNGFVPDRILPDLEEKEEEDAEVLTNNRILSRFVNIQLYHDNNAHGSENSIPLYQEQLVSTTLKDWLVVH